MAYSNQNLLNREVLANLNQLRDGPATLRLASHLLLTVSSGMVWAHHLFPLSVRLLGLLVCGIGLATFFAPLHECCHRTAFRSRRVNDIVAWLAGLLSFYNATYYRRYHQWHHRYTHQPGLDPELEDPVPTNSWSYLRELSGWNWWSGKWGNYAQLLWGDLSNLNYLSPEAIPQVRRSVRLQFAVYATLALASLMSGTGFLLWFWLLPLAVGQPLLRFVLLAEHSGCSFSGDSTINTRTTRTNPALRWLMWNMPFHAEHHIYPSLPFHALPAAHVPIAPNLRHCDQGYLTVHRQLLRNLPLLGLPA